MLADRVGVSRQWIVEIEHGKPRAEIGLLLRTIDALTLEMRIVPQRHRPGDRPSDGRSRDVDIDMLVEQARKPRA